MDDFYNLKDEYLPKMGEIMKTMYKEEVMQKRLPVILEMFVLLTLSIFVSNFTEKVSLYNRSIGSAANLMLILFMSVMIVLGIMRCRERYRYSIIADQLIVHRIVKGEQIIIENIKLEDIKYIGRASKLKHKLNTRYTGRHGCSIFSFRTFCCIYKEGDGIKKFYFQPSESFINRISSFLEISRKVS